MISREEARARVAKGAAYLDQIKPGWFWRIDVGTLTLHDGCGCIVGQLHTGRRGSEFMTKLRRLAITRRQSVELGFNADTQITSKWIAMLARYGEDEARKRWYRPLQEAWIEAIADRLHPVDGMSETPAATDHRVDAVAVCAPRV